MNSGYLAPARWETRTLCTLCTSATADCRSEELLFKLIGCLPVVARDRVETGAVWPQGALVARGSCRSAQPKRIEREQHMSPHSRKHRWVTAHVTRMLRRHHRDRVRHSRRRFWARAVATRSSSAPRATLNVAVGAWEDEAVRHRPNVLWRWPGRLVPGSGSSVLSY